MLMHVPAYITELYTEADALVHSMDGILKRYGQPHYTGSYALKLMTWRDLDIYLDVNNMTEASFFELGGALAAALNPVKMSFRNEKLARTEGLPVGLYWGIYLNTWKIDVWAMEHDECMQRLQYCNNIAKKLTPETIQAIIDIKSKCWQDPGYRKSFSSKDIYEAVLEKGITNIDEFRKTLPPTRNE